ncbi:RagB/SusD family nutrient uptake outer membrane protein [Algoriphagus jejuensis]|uniref:RagB/SusD family nutrient uptake outer membrane protein n=1 Tax=Algoriphagus jejuensis TaxID=419934 RepID=A0ABP3YEP7_9BACT
MKKYLVNALLALGLIATVSCEEYLDEKPVKSILVPDTKEDVRYILDNYTTLNDNPLLVFVLADDWVTTTPNWERLNPWVQKAYLWEEEIFNPDERSTDYNRLHRKIFFANVSLDILDKIGIKDDPEAESLRGEALLVRSAALFYLAQLFLPYPDGDEEAGQLKIPVHWSSEVNVKPEWMTIAALLPKIEADLTEAYSLISQQSAFQNRPNKAVVKALLSRIYLYSGKYEDALDAASSALQAPGMLLDYSEYSPEKPYPFFLFNEESMYYGYSNSYLVTDGPASFINPELYSDYSDNDFRKELFFTSGANGDPLFRGSYTGDFNLFTGISYSEVLLNATESAVRLGKVEEGMTLLETLAQNRYKDLELWRESIGADLLGAVTRERRRELVFRGTRWGDMKRLVAIGEITLPIKREIHEESYELASESQLTLQLPPYEASLEIN